MQRIKYSWPEGGMHMSTALRWSLSGIVFGVITYVIVQSVSAMKRAIRKSPLNQSFSEKKERENIESNLERHSNDENKNPVSRIDRTHDKSYEIAWDEIESGNKDKAVWGTTVKRCVNSFRRRSSFPRLSSSRQLHL